jgi:hypothetical protein
MMRRIGTLTGFLARNLLLSLTGLFYVLASLVFYWLAFQQRTPEVSYFLLLIGLFGAVLTFLVTLSLASRANQPMNIPFLVRLPSRVEFLVAVLLAALLLALLLQSLVATMALLYNGPNLSWWHAVQIPPIWLSLNILAAVMALHASELATAGWSRVYVYGALAVLLFLHSNQALLSNWFAGRLAALASLFLRRGWLQLSNQAQSGADWLSREGASYLGQVVGFVFWPFYAIGDAAVTGFFTRVQALAPSVLLIYAIILFLLAADIFANKDMIMSE